MGTGTRRARAALVLVVMLAVASCSSDKPVDRVGSPPGTHQDGTPATPLPVDGEREGSSSGGSGSAATSTSTSAPSKGTGSGSGGRSGSTTTSTSTPTGSGGSSNTAYQGARNGPGAFARTLLRPQPATRLVVELMVQPGADPAQSSVDHLLQVLADETRKPITLADRIALPAGDGTTTAEEIRTLSDAHGRTAQGGNQAVLRLLFLRGRYYERTDDPDDDDGGSALGVAVRGDTMAVFKDKVKATASTSALVSAAMIEDAVVIHETGHLLGLVDLVLDTGRADPKHPGHSPNKESVMYHAVEGTLVLQDLGGPPPRNFDSADKADLATMRTGG